MFRYAAVDGLLGREGKRHARNGKIFGAREMDKTLRWS